ncbi:MAG: zinc finger protein 839 [Marinilabiliales bacterium]|nr:zinc finger protein 839 [Marinilabiliales bacterium]
MRDRARRHGVGGGRSVRRHPAFAARVCLGHRPGHGPRGPRRSRHPRRLAGAGRAPRSHALHLHGHGGPAANHGRAGSRAGCRRKHPPRACSGLRSAGSARWWRRAAALADAVAAAGLHGACRS